MNRLRLRAFTLIELLAAISVLAVMAVLSIGVVNRVKTKANETAALNNQRSLNQAILLSTADSDARFPVMRNYPWEEVLRPDGEPAGWMHEVLAEYLEVRVNGDVLPDVFRSPVVESRRIPAWLAEGKMHSHYRYNSLSAPGNRAARPNRAMITTSTVWPDWPAEEMPLQLGGAGLHVGYADGRVERISYEEYMERTGGSESADKPFFGEGW